MCDIDECWCGVGNQFVFVDEDAIEFQTLETVAYVHKYSHGMRYSLCEKHLLEMTEIMTMAHIKVKMHHDARYGMIYFFTKVG